MNNLLCISIFPFTVNHNATSSVDGNGSPPKIRHLNEDEGVSSRFRISSKEKRRNNDGVIWIIVTEFISIDESNSFADSLISFDTMRIVAPLNNPRQRSTTKGSNVGGDDM